MTPFLDLRKGPLLPPAQRRKRSRLRYSLRYSGDAAQPRAGSRFLTPASGPESQLPAHKPGSTPASPTGQVCSSDGLPRRGGGLFTLLRPMEALPDPPNRTARTRALRGEDRTGGSRSPPRRPLGKGEIPVPPPSGERKGGGRVLSRSTWPGGRPAAKAQTALVQAHPASFLA